jgi:hypothetical protein
MANFKTQTEAQESFDKVQDIECFGRNQWWKYHCSRGETQKRATTFVA